MTDYTFTSRGRPPGFEGNDAIVVLGKLNNAGDFVGEAWKGGGDNFQSVSYIYKDGVYSSVDYPGASYTTARGINDRGQIVGRYEPDQNSDLMRGFIYDGTKYTSLEVPGSRSNGAGDINNSGTVVGSYKDNNDVSHGYIYNGGTYTTVDVPGAKTTYLNGVNDRGIAVGGYDTGSGVVSGFVYANGNVQTLNYPGASATSLSDISNDGTIVGLAYTQPTTSNPVGSVGFIYKNGVFNVVDRAGEIAGINDSGQILAQTADRNISVSNPLCFVSVLPSPPTIVRGEA